MLSDSIRNYYDNINRNSINAEFKEIMRIWTVPEISPRNGLD